MRIEVRHVTRMEGHAHIVVNLERGELVDCRLEVVEAPRFFEAILRGRHYSDVAPLVSRICGVCSNAHTLVSLAATEAALGVEVSDQTRDLRRLLACGEMLQSHLLHLYFMAAPDYLERGSLFPHERGRRELLVRAVRLKRIGTDLCRVVGGRAVHPVTPRVGGFSAVPEPADLRSLRDRLVGALPDLEATAEMVRGFRFPHLEAPAEAVSLAPDPGYPLTGASVVTNTGHEAPVEGWHGAIREYLVDHSTAKFAEGPRGVYRVGPLARMANGFGRLGPMAAGVARAMGLDPGGSNPYHAVAARLVEIVHWVEESIQVIDRLLVRGLRREAPAEPRNAAGGRAVAAVEAPRGLLIHAYQYDGSGRIARAECIIPTAQNLGRIEADLAAAVRAYADRGPETLSRLLKILIRAYDPCISCATHALRVAFVAR